MSLSRRQFLSVLAGATATAAGLGLPIVYQYVEQTRRLSLPEGAPGQLSPATLHTLRALTEAVFIAYPVDLDRYAAYFAFHAENIAGYHTVYTDFARALDQAAHWAYRRSFADCAAPARRETLKPWFHVPQTREERLIAAATRGIEWMRYSRYVIKEILELFMNTDAWIAVGYDAWPGMPRGLDSYRQPPPQRST